MPAEYKEVAPLTDPVVDDISKPEPLPQPEPISTPSPEASIPDTKEPLPSRPPDSGKAATTQPKPTKSIATISLIIITLLAVITASIFYNQNKQLRVQIQDLTNTIEGQAISAVPIPVTEPTLTPNTTPTITTSPTTTPSATPEPKTELQQALSLAQETYPSAQLILITSDNPHLENQISTKYWFRQNLDTKKYLYISSVNNQLSLVDQQIYVSPDNNIPSLNQRLEEESLGSTIEQALAQAGSLCNEPEKCQNAPATKAQFLDTGTNLLWQITYQIEDQASPTIFQIDSLTKEVIYQSQK